MHRTSRVIPTLVLHLPSVVLLFWCHSCIELALWVTMNLPAFGVAGGAEVLSLVTKLVMVVVSCSD